MSIQAVIFDLDGVLLDTEPAHKERVIRFFRSRGLEVAPADVDGLVGCAHADALARMQAWWDVTPNPLADERELGLERSLERAYGAPSERIDHTKLVNPGVERALDAFEARGVRVAVASSTTPAGIQEELGDAALFDRFDVVVSGDDFDHGKPAPDVYLAALDRLGLLADECVAVEDSPIGIAAACAAGLRVVVKREDRFGFTQEGGTWYVDRIDEILEIKELWQA